MLTLAYDNKLRGYDSRTGTLWLVLENSNLVGRCRFTVTKPVLKPPMG